MYSTEAVWLYICVHLMIDMLYIVNYYYFLKISNMQIAKEVKGTGKDLQPYVAE